MTITEIASSEQLQNFMTEPTERLVEMMARTEGAVMVLGADGKMGPELVETMVRADQQAGIQKRSIMAAGLFVTDMGKVAQERFESVLGVRTFAGDLTHDEALAELPEAESVIFMVGFKFGSAADPGKAILLNTILPSRVAMKYDSSRFVVFSSGNPYPHTQPEHGGSRESDKLDPQGIYGYSIVARETAFTLSAHGHDGQKHCFYRLMYAQHLCYGVLVDLARMIRDGKPISLEMPYVNLISQRDAVDRAIRALQIAANPPIVLNVAGPITRVRKIAEDLGRYLGEEPILVGQEAPDALIANDDFCVQNFGPYRDSVADMIEAAARWVAHGGEHWNLPTMFGQVKHEY